MMRANHDDGEESSRLSDDERPQDGNDSGPAVECNDLASECLLEDLPEPELLTDSEDKSFHPRLCVHKSPTGQTLRDLSLRAIQCDDSDSEASDILYEPTAESLPRSRNSQRCVAHSPVPQALFRRLAPWSKIVMQGGTNLGSRSSTRLNSKPSCSGTDLAAGAASVSAYEADAASGNFAPRVEETVGDMSPEASQSELLEDLPEPELLTDSEGESFHPRLCMRGSPTDQKMHDLSLRVRRCDDSDSEASDILYVSSEERLPRSQNSRRCVAHPPVPRAVFKRLAPRRNIVIEGSTNLGNLQDPVAGSAVSILKLRRRTRAANDLLPHGPVKQIGPNYDQGNQWQTDSRPSTRLNSKQSCFETDSSLPFIGIAVTGATVSDVEDGSDRGPAVEADAASGNFAPRVGRTHATSPHAGTLSI